ncbi:MAG: histidinol phosphate phosphatase domain-containing protein [Nitrospiraceae bacterium]|nr:MAG: histidinol phosphate phosphatase domain-containing protein [Nitrospiraceae bacterium]
MIDLHMHTLLSDGALLPAELIQRAYHAGYRAMALTDHVDMSNMDFVIPRIVEAVNELSGYTDVTVLPGAEITHVPPKLIRGLVKKARKLGAQIVIVHGETLAEPVAPGTNRAGIEAGADIISHPGLISRADALKARHKGIALEITARKGHSISNGHVAKIAMETGALLVVNTDSHGPEDLITRERAKTILQAAGISRISDINRILKNSEKIVHAFRRS